jgi:hypothetical protein
MQQILSVPLKGSIYGKGDPIYIKVDRHKNLKFGARLIIRSDIYVMYPDNFEFQL